MSETDDSRWVRDARRKLRLSHWDFATMLGYVGNCRRDMTYFLESGRRPLREPQRRLIEAYLDGYRPEDWPNVSRFDEYGNFIDELNTWNRRG